MSFIKFLRSCVLFCYLSIVVYLFQFSPCLLSIWPAITQPDGQFPPLPSLPPRPPPHLPSPPKFSYLRTSVMFTSLVNRSARPWLTGLRGCFVIILTGLMTDSGGGGLVAAKGRLLSHNNYLSVDVDCRDDRIKVCSFRFLPTLYEC